MEAAWLLWYVSFDAHDNIAFVRCTKHFFHQHITSIMARQAYFTVPKSEPRMSVAPPKQDQKSIVSTIKLPTLALTHCSAPCRLTQPRTRQTDKRTLFIDGSCMPAELVARSRSRSLLHPYSWASVSVLNKLDGRQADVSTHFLQRRMGSYI